jgi:hypothetical protein
MRNLGQPIFWQAGGIPPIYGVCWFFIFRTGDHFLHNPTRLSTDIGQLSTEIVENGPFASFLERIAQPHI